MVTVPEEDEASGVKLAPLYRPLASVPPEIVPRWMVMVVLAPEPMAPSALAWPEATMDWRWASWSTCTV